jgi:hypothetical protein
MQILQNNFVFGMNRLWVIERIWALTTFRHGGPERESITITSDEAG